MKARFAGQPEPLLIGVIKEETVKGSAAAIRQAALNGATAIDLHLSVLDPSEVTVEQLRPAFACTDLPVMALQYNMDYMGRKLSATHEERMQQLMTAVEAGAACVDIQGYTFSPGDTRDSMDPAKVEEGMSFVAKLPKEITLDPETIEKQKEMIRKFHEKGADVLMSCHINVNLNCQEMVDMVRFLLERDMDVVKVVGVCDTDEELAEYFKTVLTLKNTFPGKDIHYHCNGKKGPLTRALGPMLGSYLMFCNDGYTPASDLNQLHLSTMTQVWNLLKRQGVL